MANVAQFPKQTRPTSFGKILSLAGLAAFAIGGVLAWFEPDIRALVTSSGAAVGAVQVGQAREARSFELCTGPTRINCVVDGDTFWQDGVKIRIADIDTPEVSEPQCASEAELGARATRRLLELLNAGHYELAAWENRDEDKYGRKLRVVMRGGQSIGDKLVLEGLARTWTGRREPWC
ncbi:thermonuclease family protein [Rhizobium sp. TRM96647]|uniref:thermonuclease family protein n=1 Tax=unclassified Rhizobium TaxID=2613769 RepID=UPI0021E90B3A|nr:MULTISPECIES: thermonuclease family protein [unclassified Rhizobium]MCV3734973.1 thermonuclease family protein [Rhizobium sp. TRM96647]MCV3757343.1 thermonuclease family protein [Rhizobium sp. TRM96650]